MAQVIVGDGESINSALRRFQRSVARAGIFADMCKKRYFETTLEKRRRKLKARRRQTKHRSR